MFLTNVAAGETELGEQAFIGLIGGAALLTDAAEQTLAEHRFQRGGNEERFHTHVDQTRDRARRIVGVQGAENEMAGERGLHRDLRRLQIARLPDHDPVRVLPKKGTQHPREGQPDAFVHRHLNDAFEIILDRFLGGKQLGIDRIDLAQTGIQRRRFS